MAGCDRALTAGHTPGTRLQDANPVPENARPPIGDVWHKLAAPAQPAAVPSDRTSRRRTGRVIVASTQLAGRVGTVSALDPRTGAIRALITAGVGGTRMAALRGSIFQYRPGSAFDIVTAAAALDSGRYTAASELAAPATRRVSGVTVRNASGSAMAA